MFVFGHLGIGNTLATPFRRGLARRWILVGTLLPDLIDKPIYYLLIWIRGVRGAELGLISGGRTFGHTALTLAGLGLISMILKSRLVAALAVGLATHLVLDGISDVYWTSQGRGPIESALFWPFLTNHFPVSPYNSMGEHFWSFANPFAIVTELAGAGLLFWETWKIRHRIQILAYFRERRFSLKLRRRRKRVSETL